MGTHHDDAGRLGGAAVVREQGAGQALYLVSMVRLVNDLLPTISLSGKFIRSLAYLKLRHKEDQGDFTYEEWK